MINLKIKHNAKSYRLGGGVLHVKISSFKTKHKNQNKSWKNWDSAQSYKVDFWVLTTKLTFVRFYRP